MLWVRAGLNKYVKSKKGKQVNMPCDSSHLEPSQVEIETRRAAVLLRYVYSKLGKPIPANVEKAADYIYACDYGIIPALCAELKQMSAETLEAIVYDAKNKTARDLADWWEEHQEVDRKREEKEAAEVKEQEDKDRQEYARLKSKFD